MSKKILFFTVIVTVALCWIYYAQDSLVIQTEQACIFEQSNAQGQGKSNIVTPVRRRKFVSNKLWRDDAPAKLEKEDGAIVHVKTLNDQEYEEQLNLKLKEEVDEVIVASLDVFATSSKENLMSEIGDVYEVLDCIIAHYNLSKEHIQAMQDAKRIARGSYLTRQYVTYAEYLPDGFMVPYCLQQPDKYQEIFD